MKSGDEAGSDLGGIGAGQTVVAAAVAEGELVVFQAHQMQEGGVQVVEMDFSINRRCSGVGAVITAILAIVVPILVFIGFIIFMGYVISKNPLKMYRDWRARNEPEGPLKQPNVLAA